jgi:hypothetical protein
VTIRAAIVLAVVVPARLLVAQTPHQASALRGLKAVRVTVNFQSGAPERAGAADTTQLRGQVEMELQHAGIATSATGASVPQLSLNVTLLSRPESPCRPDSVLHWYSFRLELRQWAMISQRPPTYVWATTWGLGGVGFSNESHIAAEIVLSVHQITQTFVNEFHADNATGP